MATIDQRFIEYIVKTLVNNPEKVEVERKIDEKGVLLTLTVDPEDVGRVIGRRGATAQAIRVLLRALGTKQDARYNLKIVNTDEEGERGARGADDAENTSSDGSNEDADGTEAEATEVAAEDDSEDVEEFDDSDDEESGDDEGDGTLESDTEDSALAKKTRAELADLDDFDI